MAPEFNPGVIHCQEGVRATSVVTCGLYGPLHADQVSFPSFSAGRGFQRFGIRAIRRRLRRLPGKLVKRLPESEVVLSVARAFAEKVSLDSGARFLAE